jgi:hypothetical protein
LRIGLGITPDMVGARRHRDDLVLDVAGPHGSVTVKTWFASETQRIEVIEFADGTALDETMVRRLVRHRHDNNWHEEGHCMDDRRDERRNAAPQPSRDRGDDRAEESLSSRSRASSSAQASIATRALSLWRPTNARTAEFEVLGRRERRLPQAMPGRQPLNGLR